MSKLNEKVALITGGSRGIGAAIAKRLAADGASVAITYAKEASAASAVVKAIELRGGKAVAIQADAADWACSSRSDTTRRSTGVPPRLSVAPIAPCPRPGACRLRRYQGSGLQTVRMQPCLPPVSEDVPYRARSSVSQPQSSRRRRSAQSQIAVMPPSTGRSTPAMKLASSDARNKAVDAISSGRPSRPNGTASANWARAWSAPSLVGACWSKIGVSIGPGLIALTRMRRSFNSAVQVRTEERTAALVAL